MKIKEIVKLLDDWAPPGAAWEKDNPGLQVGNPDAEVVNILLSLDTTEEIVREAITKRCNVIISHHPLLYHSIKKINTSNDSISRIISALLKNDITLLSYHTNLDFTRGGVSFRLAELIGLQNPEFLHQSENSVNKITVFVPESHVQSVANAMFSAGAGKIGEYDHCSFSSSGTGTFLGGENTNPAVGTKMQEESVAEVRLEVLTDTWNTAKVVSALRAAHPYEEPAFDIFRTLNRNTRFGAGVIGTLPNPTDSGAFLEHVKYRLQLNACRYTPGASDVIKKVAVCGGAGSDLLKTAIGLGADAFITADISYHVFHDAHNTIMLIDAGHYETEIPILDTINIYLTQFVTKRESSTQVFITEHTTNPVKFFK